MQNRKRWTVVLAGGEGTRLSPLIRLWRGRHVPKQYCAFSGRKSMLEHTLDRAAQAASDERILTVINQGHRQFLPKNGVPRGRLIEQPCNKDTAPGIFLPAAHVLKADPEATLLILPSDHYVDPTHRFAECLGQAADLAELHAKSVVLLAAVPDSPEREYGWISRGSAVSWRSGWDAHRVGRFVEKPGAEDALDLFQSGALWNTMVIAVKARTLWELGRALLPRLMHDFDTLRAVIGGPREEEATAIAYRNLVGANFSRDILQQIPERILAIPMKGVSWSDWGRPERIVSTLGRAGERPAFPVGLLAGLGAAA